MPAPLRGLLAAIVFLTRVPVGRREYRTSDWRWSAGWFPFVGALLGAVQAASWMALEPLPPFSRAAIVVSIGVLLTGGFHEDGLADTADALGGARSRDSLFAILKDSRVGTFGALALILSVLTRVSLVAELDDLAPVGLVLAGCLARTAPVWLMAALPYVTGDGTAKSRHVTGAAAGQVLLATLFAAAALLSSWQWAGLPVAWLWRAPVLLAALAAFAGFRFWRRAGGLTGDFLGALEQLGEVGVLALLAAR